MHTSLTIALVGLLALASCGDGEVPTSDIAGIWWAVELDGEPIEIGRNTAELPWFEIDASTIAGNFGCNAGGGSYRLQDTRLRVSNLESEQELCGIPDGSETMVPTERVLREMLASTGATVEVSDETMTWTGAGHTITFTAASGKPPPPTTAPQQEFDRLSCAPGVVVQYDRPVDGVSPEELAVEIEPATERVVGDGPLRWWGYDDQDEVTVGVFLEDVPDPDYQVVACQG